MSIVDRLITRLEVDEGDYVRGTDNAVDATRDLQRAQDGLGASLSGLNGLARSAGSAIGTAIGALTAGIVGLGVAASSRAAEFDAMVAALAALEGSADKAASAVERLRAIASQPGLSFSEAVSGFTGLRRAGIDAALGFDLVEGAGRANALAGGGADELNRMLMALSQIAVKAKVSQEELLQLAEAGFSPFLILKDAFGTADTEQLAKQGVDAQRALQALAAGMLALPGAGDTAKNTFENLRIALDNALIAIGQSLNVVLVPLAQEFTSVLDELRGSGSLSEIGQALGNIVRSLTQGITAQSLESGFIRVVSAFQAAAAYAPIFAEGVDILMGQMSNFFEGISIGLQQVGLAAQKLFFTILGPVGGIYSMASLEPRIDALSEQEQARRDRGAALDQREQARREAAQGMMTYDDYLAINARRMAAAKRRGEQGLAAGTGSAQDQGGAALPQSGPSFMPPLARESLSILGAIERNTRPAFGSAEAFGGGALGRMGVTPVELSQIRAGRPSGFAQRLAEIIGAEMARVVDQRVADMLRYGALQSR